MPIESLYQKVSSLLNEKSAEARAMAKQLMLEKKVGTEKVNRTIERYLESWGDTTRPGVLALAHEAVGGAIERILPLQVALLFIDVTMDIHDDIIDDSPTKRTKKTIYGKLGKTSTLLIGDAFMVAGFHYLSKAMENIAKERRLYVMDVIESFLLEVVKAHIFEEQLKYKKLETKPETYFEILTRKASDIEGRMRIGGIYGGGSVKEIEALGKYGRVVGTLLAAKSEFVDVFEPCELTHRIEKEVLPLPILYALRNPKNGKQIREILKKKNIGKKECAELVEYIYNTKELAFLLRRLRHMKREAIESLDSIKNSQIKQELRLLVEFLLEDL